MVRRGFAILALLLASHGPVRGDDPVPTLPSEIAEKFVAAYRAKDAGAMAALAKPQIPDPFLVAHEIFGMRSDEALAKGAPAGDAIAAAAEWAKRANVDRSIAGLPALVERWRRASAEDLARDRRLRRALADVWAAVGDDCASVLKIAEAAEADRKAFPACVAGVFIAAQRARCLSVLGRRDEGTAEFRKVADDAAAIGWVTFRIDALQRAANGHQALGHMDAAVAGFEEVLAVQEAVGATYDATATRVEIGVMYRRLGTPLKSIPYYETALRELEKMGNRAGVANTRYNLAVAWTETGDLDRATEAYAKARTEMEAAGDGTGVVAVLLGTGHLAQTRGDLVEAIRVLEEGLAKAVEIQDVPGESAAITDLAVLYANAGQYSKALEFGLRAVERMTAAKDARGLAHAHAVLADVYSHLGRFADALTEEEDAASRFETLGDQRRHASALTTLGGIHIAADNPALARPILERALAEHRRLGDRRDAAGDLTNLAMTYAHEGSHDLALRSYEEALSELKAVGDRLAVAQTLVAIGNLHYRAKRPKEALETLTQAIEAHRAAGSRGGAASALVSIGLVHRGGGEHEEAIEAYRQAIAELEALGDRSGVAVARENLAYSELALHQTAAASKHARESLEASLEQGAALGDEEAFGVRAGLRGVADIGLRAADAASREPSAVPAEVAASAFWFVEAGRALSLAGALRHRAAFLDAKIPPTLLVAEAAARKRLVRQREALATLAARRDPAREEIRVQRDRVDAAYVELQAAVARTQREQKRAAAVAYPRPVALAAFQAGLAPDVAFVEYALTDADAFAVVVTGTAAALVDLGPAEEIVARADDLLSATAARSDEAVAAADLYERLLRPLEPQLGGAARVIVAGDGVLAFFPFEALVRVEGAARARAIEKFQFDYVPSATVLAALLEDAASSRDGHGLIALGDPVYGAAAGPALAVSRDAAERGLTKLDPLPGTREEAIRLAALFPEKERTVLLGESANAGGLEAAIAAAKSRLRVLHVGCHGHIDAQRPRLSGLVLSHGEVLTLDQVYGMQIPADLVVLSACKTARGTTMRGEGVMGLVRGFFFAGAPRVVVSDWSVSDESTRNLMVAFYTKMLKGGLSPGAALRAAKIEMLKAGGARAHPYHWAPFVLWGLGE